MQSSLETQNKRAFSRIPISLFGVCSASGLSRNIEVRNFCIGGMFISYQVPTNLPSEQIFTPRQDETIEVHCSIPTPLGNKDVMFQGRVVRTDGDSAGIVFINPDLSNLQLIQDYAKTHHSSQIQQRKKEEHDIDGSLLDGNKARELIRSCIAIAEEILDPIMEELLKKAADSLFMKAGEIKDNGEQNMCFEGIEILKNSGAKYTKTFHVRFMEHLNNFPNNWKPTSQQDEDVDLSNLSLSLVEDEALNDWIAISDMANKSEVKYKEHLYGIERRLSVIYGINIDKENNPYGPAAFCYVLKNVVSEINLESRIGQIWYRIFKNILEERLGDLYDKLNNHLKNNNVLPKLKYRVKRYPTSDHSSQAVTGNINQQQPVRQNEIDSHRGQHNVTATQTRPGISPAQGGATIQDTHLPQRSHDGIQPTPDQGNNIQINTPHAQKIDAPLGVVQSASTNSQGLHKLVQELLSMHPMHSVKASTNSELAARQSGYNITENNASTAMPHAVQTPFDTNELISALTNIRVDDFPKNISGLVTNNVESHILSVLPILMNNPANNRIDSNMRNVLETTGNIYDSMLKDNLIAGSVKNWLKRLEMPIFKIAMQDDSVFFDKSNLARKFINKLSRLELYGDDVRVSGDSSIKTKIDSFLDKIVDKEDITPQTFAEILKEIDMLITAQSKAYIENVHDVLAECVEYQSKLDQVRDDKNSVQVDEGQDDSLVESRKRVSRIKVGDWVLFSTGTTEPKKIRVTWVSKNKDRFVFTNIQGRKESVLKVDELAQHLQNKTAVVLSNVNETTFDRAQLSTLQNIHQKLIFNTTHDELTGLVNRRELENIISSALKSAAVNAVDHTLCCMYIDHLKIIKNTCGTEAGDRLLIELSNLMKITLRGQGKIARIGEYELAIFLTDCSSEKALEIIEEQLKIINEYNFYWEGNRYSTSFSTGLVNFDATYNDIPLLLQNAEAACQIAKEKGSNKLHRSHIDDDSISMHKKLVEWVSRIDELLDSNSLYLRYQPIIPINPECNLQKHAEILLGLNDEDGNPISPEHYILAAEKYGRIAKIDRWVIGNVLQWMVSHSDKLDELGMLTINISGVSLNDVGFASFIIEQIEKTGVPTDNLCFEITETAGIDNLTDAAQFIEDIKQTGCSFSLDDFGTGLSSYSYLKNLPVNYLKIDGSFITGIGNNPSDIAVVKSITEIGHFMDKKIIAECVESENTIKLLQDLGVDYVQGYAIKKPAPLSELK